MWTHTEKVSGACARCEKETRVLRKGSANTDFADSPQVIDIACSSCGYAYSRERVEKA